MYYSRNNKAKDHSHSIFIEFEWNERTRCCRGGARRTHDLLVCLSTPEKPSAVMENLCNIVQETVGYNKSLNRQPYKSRKRASIPGHVRRYTERLVPGGRALAKSICDQKGKYNRSVSITKLNYSVAKKEHRSKKSMLIDRGANDGVAGQDIRIKAKSDQSVNIMRIDNHEMKNIPIGTVGGVILLQCGEVISIMHQYAIAGKGRTIHSCAQLEPYKNKVDHKLKKVGGKQLITTLDGYVHPIDIINRLPYTPMRPFSNEEWKKLPHIVWSSDTTWDPSVIDHVVTNNNQWRKGINVLRLNHPFNNYGEYTNQEFTRIIEERYGVEAHIYNIMDLNAKINLITTN